MPKKSPPKDEIGIDGAEEVLDEESDQEQEEEAEAGDEEEGVEEAEEGAQAEKEGREEDVDGDEEPVEVAEVEEEQQRPVRRRPARTRPAGRRAYREEPKSKRKLYALALGIIILVPVIGIVYFFLGPPGDVKKIDLITRPFEREDGSGVVLFAQIDTGKPSSLSGSADIIISLGGNTVYSGKIDVSDSRASKELQLADFATGNGDYTAKFIYQGFTQTTNFPVNEIIETMNATAWAINVTINATLAPVGTARLGVRVVMMSSSGVIQLATAKDSLEVEVGRGAIPEKYTENVAGKAQFEKNYPLPGNGNYTVKVTFQNSNVKPGTKYSSITSVANDTSNLSHPYVYVAIPPQANAGPDQEVPWKIQDQGAIVTLDGSRSMAYEGATISQYWWDYHDGTAEDQMIVTHKYPYKNNVETPFYVATLTVTDSNGQISSDEVHIVVT